MAKIKTTAKISTKQPSKRSQKATLAGLDTCMRVIIFPKFAHKSKMNKAGFFTFVSMCMPTKNVKILRRFSHMFSEELTLSQINKNKKDPSINSQQFATVCRKIAGILRLKYAKLTQLAVEMVSIVNLYFGKESYSVACIGGRRDDVHEVWNGFDPYEHFV
jgi:hypothetical protein